MVGRGLLQKYFCKTLFQNICSNTEVNANFLFSHYMSMEILSCHSNESIWATTITNTIYVEANVMNMYVKFLLHPPYGIWGENFSIFFRNLPFMLPWQPIKFSDLDKIHMNRRGPLNEHFCKTFYQNICNETAVNDNFYFSHYKSAATISCHINQSSYPMWTKTYINRSLCLLML